MAAASETTENCDSSAEENKNSENKVKLPDLKVQELKVQLEKRNLDKTGVKSVLFERLKNALIEEGEDPENYAFDHVSDNPTKLSSQKKTKISVRETNGEVNLKDDLNDSIVLDIKDEVIDDIGDETIDLAIDNDDKCSNEVTLQLSIDEEDAAQLNDEENILEVSKAVDSEVEDKPDTKKHIDTISENNSKSDNVTSVSTTPTKASKPLNEEVKQGKKLTVSKNSESSNAISKASKVLIKNDIKKPVSTLAKSLCITGLPSTVRAADLKVLFSKQGRVLSVKIIKSTKQTSGKCYGYVTMATSKDATKAVQNLNGKDFNGRTITVEKAQNEPGALVKKLESKLISPRAKLAVSTKKPVKKVLSSSKVSDTPKSNSSLERKVNKQESKPSTKKSTESSDKSKEKKASNRPKEKPLERKSRESKDKEYKSREINDRFRKRPPFRRPPPSRPRQHPFSFSDRPRFGTARRAFAPKPYSSRGGFSRDRLSRPYTTSYSLQKIREERLKLRAEREIEKRRLEEITRHRMIERKQREEAYRLEREKEKLRLEREMLEREKAEIIKLEREKQRLERERLERERDELRRQSELRRNSVKRPIARVHERETEQYWKKPVPRYESHASFSGESTTNARYNYQSKERATIPAPKHEYDRRTERYTPKTVEPISRIGYENRESRREITVRSRDERHVYDRSIYRADREARPSFQDRHSTARRETSRMDWKHDRRVHERVVPSTSSSSSRKMYY